jgi:hypothetical protein
MVGKPALENMHKLFLEALRHREQEIVPYLAIIGPALGGFVWLLSRTDEPEVFVVGTIGVLFLLLVGAIYSLALGYNYRYITLELAKLEEKLGITNAMLRGWPRDAEAFRRRYVVCPDIPILRSIPWCTPPEVIKVFWLAFLVAMFGVSAAVYRFRYEICVRPILISAGVSFAIAWGIYPLWFGWKLRRKCNDELATPHVDPPNPVES